MTKGELKAWKLSICIVQGVPRILGDHLTWIQKAAEKDKR
jgi:hypothetical protein